MLCLDSVALWHGGVDTEGEHYEQLLDTIKRRKTAYLDHVIRNQFLPTNS